MDWKDVSAAVGLAAGIIAILTVGWPAFVVLFQILVVLFLLAVPVLIAIGIATSIEEHWGALGCWICGLAGATVLAGLIYWWLANRGG